MAEVVESAVVEPVAAETGGEVSTETAYEQPGETGPETTAEGETQEQSFDGRTPAEFKEWIKSLEKTNPRAAKQIRGAFYESQQLRKLYPEGLKQVEKMARLSEEVGGAEGFEKIQGELNEFSDVAKMYMEGDPGFVQDLIESDKGAFLKLIPNATREHPKVAPEEYTHLMEVIVVETIRDPLAEVYQVLVSDEKTKPAAEKLARWFNGLDSQARTQPQPKVDPDREKLNQERQQFEDEKKSRFRADVDAEMGRLNMPQFEKAIAEQFAKAGKNLASYRSKAPESYRMLFENCVQNLDKYLSTAEKGFLDQYNALLAAGEKERAIRLAQAKLKALIPQSVSRTVRTFMSFGMTGKPAIPEPKTQAAATGMKMLPKEPAREQLDFSRMGAKASEMVLSGRAYIKGQKEMVRW